MSIIYARIAKFSIGLLILFFCASFIAIASHSDSSSWLYSISQLIFGFLFFPFFALVLFYMQNPIESGLRNYDFKDDDKVKELVVDLLDGVSQQVRIGIYESSELDAFAVGSLFGKQATIGFSSELVARASDRQLRAIAAHEIAHVKNGDAQNKYSILAFHRVLQEYPRISGIFADAILKSVYRVLAIAIPILFLVLFVTNQNMTPEQLYTACRPVLLFALPALIALAIAWLLPKILMSVFFVYSREREYAADKDAAEMTSFDDMLSALELLPEGTDAFSFFDSHPPMRDRKIRLQQFALREKL